MTSYRDLEWETGYLVATRVPLSPSNTLRLSLTQTRRIYTDCHLLT